MSVLRDLFVKNKIVFVLCALFLMSGCKKEASDNIPEVPKGNPNQIILTVNGTEITEDMTDAKLGAYLIYNPFAGEDDIRGARKTVALSIAEALLLDQKAAENGTKTTAEEDAQTEILIEFVYKDKSRIEKAAAYKNIPISEMLRDNLIEYKKMKFLAGLPEAEKPTNAEIDQFVEENRKTFAEKPQRKIVFQILKRHDGTEKGKQKARKTLEKAKKAVENGMEFEKAVKKYSDLEFDDPATFLGAFWPEFRGYGKAVTDTVWALEPGECSAVYEGEPLSFSVFYVSEILPEEKLSEAQWRSWAALLLTLQKNENLYYRLSELLFEDAEVIFSLEYNAVPEV